MITGKGIIRNIDHLGRIVLPKEFRRSLGIPEKSPVEICLDEDHVKIYKASGKETIECAECGADKKLFKLEKTALCRSCLLKMTKQ